VLLVHKSASLSLHRALLSRVAVVNSGFFHDPLPASSTRHQLPHAALRHHYKTPPAAFDSDAGKIWLADEVDLLGKTELSFHDLVRQIDDQSEASQRASPGASKQHLVCNPALALHTFPCDPAN